MPTGNRSRKTISNKPILPDQNTVLMIRGFHHSTVPSLCTWAYGFRPIVIGYLHLILLGVISLFLIGYALQEKYISFNKKATYGIAIFICGIILTEALLMIQGLGAIKYQAIPYVNELLFTAAFIMFTGILALCLSSKQPNSC